MESKWRQNIPLLGMADSNWRLAARLLEAPWLLLVNIAGPPANFARFYDISDPDQLPVQLNIGTSYNNHFPHGYEVEPDQI